MSQQRDVAPATLAGGKCAVLAGVCAGESLVVCGDARCAMVRDMWPVAWFWGGRGETWLCAGKLGETKNAGLLVRRLAFLGDVRPSYRQARNSCG